MVDLPNGTTNAAVDPTLAEASADEAREVVIRLFKEELAVAKRVVPTSRVEVARVTHSREQFVGELLNYERIEIEWIPFEKCCPRFGKRETASSSFTLRKLSRSNGISS
jgi:hypothetical protein